MLTEEQTRMLESAWGPARADGTLGSATIEALDEHAAGFVPAAVRVRRQEPGGAPAVRPDAADPAAVGGREGIDLGAGAGVPGLLLALRDPAWRWRLVDAQASRCAHAANAVRALGIGDRVSVVHGRADELGHDPAWRGVADLVVARLFGTPAETAECGVPLLSPGGRLVVSVSEATRAVWDDVDLAALSAAIDDEWSTPSGRYLSVRRDGVVTDRFPRRAPQRRRRPLQRAG